MPEQNWAVLENLDPGINADVTLTIYLNITADQIRPFMATVIPNVSGLRIRLTAKLQQLFRNALKIVKKSSRCDLSFKFPRSQFMGCTGQRGRLQSLQDLKY